MDQAIKYQHKSLAAGRWAKMSFAEQMSNVGSEISRALNWQKKGKMEYRDRAVYRSLELLDLSLAAAKSFPKLKELARLREAVVDYFCGTNQFASTEALWRKYFDHFIFAVHKR